MKTDLEKRSFVKGAVLFACSLAVYPLSTLLKTSSVSGIHQKMKSKFLNLFDRKESVRVIGQAYLKDHPEEANMEMLIELICGTEMRALSPKSSTELHDWLKAKTQLDFEKGNIVFLRGWMLSQTESRIYGLAALSS